MLADDGEGGKNAAYCRVRALFDALVTDVRRAVAAGMPVSTSIFVGGGTPSMLPPGDIARIVASVPVTAGAEISVECNPDDVSVDLLRAYVDAGVNRVSIGVQSMTAHVLGSLGRRHDRRNVERAVAALEAAGYVVRLGTFTYRDAPPDVTPRP